MATYQELVAQKNALEKQRADLDKQINDALRSERTGVITQIKTLMVEHGITVADLAVKTTRQGKAAPAEGVRKVAPKFRDAVTGEVWSGRGLQPKWLKAALENGRKIEEFAL
ncbi:MAG: H-NS family nucleoid-associated regulatory protein [Leptothrix ochracea]|uniref:H-NS histone family protein n=1 Tax=Leptothrix ochracea TaxID=735331 RepID=UPI0034E2E7FC